MFTGLIQAIGVVKNVDYIGNGKRFEIKTPLAYENFPLGASICCSGACMTVIDARQTNCGQTRFKIDVSIESLDKTTLNSWGEETNINIEPSLKPIDPMGGHYVSGHVDAVAKIVKIIPYDEFTEFHIRVPEDFVQYITAKGSVTLDGTSLTVNRLVTNDTFAIMLIPHTLQNTTWGQAVVGAEVNFEVDMLARYVERMLSVHYNKIEL